MTTTRGEVRNTILVGDALQRLRRLPDGSVDTVVTSPPYFRLRDYAATGQLGLESHVDEWVDQMAHIAAEIRRVLVPTGTFWLNLGDTYSTRPAEGAPRKSLLMAPERLALRLQQEGWIIRNKIAWVKPNSMPTSVKDRLNCAHEVIYVFAKQPTYFFDLDAIREPHKSLASKPRASSAATNDGWRGPNADTDRGLSRLKAEGRVGHPLGKNPGDVWRIAPRPVPGHHAVYPIAVAHRAIAAGCPEARCTKCRLPWRRGVLRALGGTAVRTALAPSCECNECPERGLVLDPFMGSGTTAIAAERLQRDWLGIELNPDFAALAQGRIAATRDPQASNPNPPPHSIRESAA